MAPAATAAATATPATPPAAATIPTIASPADAADALRGVDTLLFDQDGVLWRGDEDVPGAARALQSLAASSPPEGGGADPDRRRARRRIFFVTNNSTLSRRAYAAKLTKRLGGLAVEPGQVICSAWAAAELLRSRGFGRGGARAAERVLALGEAGLFDELDEAGIAHARGPVLGEGAASAPSEGGGAPSPQGSVPLASLDCPPSRVAAFSLDPSIGAVVVGWSSRQFTYAWIAYAAACLRELPACDTFVVTNRDAADALPTGRLLPGTGALVAAVEAAAGGGRVAVDAGKGGRWLHELLPRAIPDFDPRRAAMVGDRLDTDVAFAVEGGFRAAVLTLTGVATRAEAEAAAAGSRPTHVVASVADLAL